MRRLLAVALVFVLLVGSVPIVGTSSPERTQTASVYTQTPPERIQTSPHLLVAPQKFDDVEFRITVYPNASARWTFIYARTLNESERTQFEAFAEQFNNQQLQLYTDFSRQATALTNAGQNTTGRVMEAKQFSKRAYVGGLSQNRGKVEMSFVWTNFAAADGTQLVVGDVFEGGLYLGPDQSLVIATDEDLRFKDARPRDTMEMSSDTLQESDTVTWIGEQEFMDQRPRVKFVPLNDGTTQLGTTQVGGPDGTAQPGPGEPGTGTPWMMFVAAFVVIVGLGAALMWRQGGFGALTTTSDGRGGTGGAGTTTPSRRGKSATPSVTDEELLTDEARIKKLLNENGGRMKQVNIVEETGWSKSKVSMLLSEMEDTGAISKLRVGRENIISLDGYEPDAAGSPLDE